VEAAWRWRIDRQRAWLPARECLGKDHSRQRRRRLEENEEGQGLAGVTEAGKTKAPRAPPNGENGDKEGGLGPYRWAFGWASRRRQPLA
jgi:hypothetical protein